MIKINLKKLAFAAAGLTMLASPPLASAQAVSSSSSNASLIAILTQLVQTLEQELQQLIAARGITTPAQPTTNPAFSATSEGNTLTAEFTFLYDAGVTEITFGDGQNQIFSTPGCPPNNAGGMVNQSCVFDHTYGVPGTYTAELENSSGNVLATQIITIAGNNSIQFSASPRSGAVPLDVQFSGSIPGDNGYTINYGDGTQNILSPITGTCPSPGPCTLPSSMTVNSPHIYQSAGTYTATLTSNGNTLGTVIITVTGSNSTQPSATIDQSSLTSIPDIAPKLQGTISDTSAISIAVWRGAVTAPQSETNTDGPYVWLMSSMIRDSEITISDGHWSTAIGNSDVAGNGFDYSVFSSGEYTVAVYDDVTGHLLTTGTLTVQ